MTPHPMQIRRTPPVGGELFCSESGCRCTICIKCEKQARFITLRFRLQPLERLFGYKE
jgi:hypothetical protein